MPNVNAELLGELQKLENQVATQLAILDQKEQKLKVAESRLAQGLSKNTGAKSVEKNLARNMGNFLIPGNVGDVNKVIWPFFFPTPFTTLVPGANVRTQISVTQEAGFSWMSFTKVVFALDTLTNELTYNDPDQPVIGESQEVYYTIRDAQSGREFFNVPQSLDQVGHPRWPSILPTPYLILPNATMEVNFYNAHPSANYVAGLIFFGYRVRFEGGKNLLSTVYG